MGITLPVVELRHGIALLLVVFAGVGLVLPATSPARPSDYYSTFFSKYKPVQSALVSVGTACGYGAVTRVDQLPACGRRVAPFRTAVSRLLLFLTHTAPPPKVKTEVARLIATTKVLQQRYATLASFIARKDLARFKAIGGTGHPIDKATTAFNSVLNNLLIDLA